MQQFRRLVKWNNFGASTISVDDIFSIFPGKREGERGAVPYSISACAQLGRQKLTWWTPGATEADEFWANWPSDVAAVALAGPMWCCKKEEGTMSLSGSQEIQCRLCLKALEAKGNTRRSRSQKVTDSPKTFPLAWGLPLSLLMLFAPCLEWREGKSKKGYI